MLKKIVITLLALALIGGLLFVVQVLRESSEEGEGKPRTVAAAELRTLRNLIESSGLVEAQNSTDVRSEISGRIQKLHVENGDMVSRGDILIELDRITPEAELREAERNYEAEQLRTDRARRDYERLRDLWEREFARESEYLDALTNYRLAEIQVQVRETQLERARENLAQTTIRAPQSGMVVDITVNEGQVITGATSVNEGTRLMSIYDLDLLLVQLNVNELDIEKLQLGGVARVTFDSLPDVEIKGSVYRVSPFATQRDNVPVFRVAVAFDAGDLFIRPGISSRIRIVVEELEDVVAVPISAVFRDGRRRFIMVRNEQGEFERRNVELGLSDSGWVQIVKGVDAGEEISLLRGQTVRRG